jgi:hypothetical protein
MFELEILVRFGVQWVYLTATLPPEDENEFVQLMRLPDTADQGRREDQSKKHCVFYTWNGAEATKLRTRE